MIVAMVVYRFLMLDHVLDYNDYYNICRENGLIIVGDPLPLVIDCLFVSTSLLDLGSHRPCHSRQYSGLKGNLE
ncbi:unnamed protein product [Ilex paraguariensis]|uniref:Uncharacterized protein n=1 Tax=Ilex paraguariensis TaxID=185542 RepID=A0ABC8U6C1_9AQUA